MNWERSTATSMRCEPWIIAKLWLFGAVHYELWHDKRRDMVGRYASFDQAKAAAEREEMAGQA